MLGAWGCDNQPVTQTQLWRREVHTSPGRQVVRRGNQGWGWDHDTHRHRVPWGPTQTEESWVVKGGSAGEGEDSAQT